MHCIRKQLQLSSVTNTQTPTSAIEFTAWFYETNKKKIYRCLCFVIWPSVLYRSPYCSTADPFVDNCGAKTWGAPSQSAKVEIFASLLTLFATPTHLYLYIYSRPNVVDNVSLDLLRVIRVFLIIMFLLPVFLYLCTSLFVYFHALLSVFLN